VKLPFICSLAQKWCASGPWLLQDINKKPHAGSQTYHSAWPCGHLKWLKCQDRKTYVVSISKTKQDAAMVAAS